MNQSLYARQSRKYLRISKPLPLLERTVCPGITQERKERKAHPWREGQTIPTKPIPTRRIPGAIAKSSSVWRGACKAFLLLRYEKSESYLNLVRFGATAARMIYDARRITFTTACTDFTTEEKINNPQIPGKEKGEGFPLGFDLHTGRRTLGRRGEQAGLV